MAAVYTAAYDISLMPRNLLKHEKIYDYITIWMATGRGGLFELANINRLIHFYEGATGLKTSYTSGLGYCVSASTRYGGMKHIAVVVHARTSTLRSSDASSIFKLRLCQLRACKL